MATLVPEIPADQILESVKNEGSKGCRGGTNLQAMIALFSKTEVLLSSKPHKARAISKAMGEMGVPRTLSRLPIGHIDEPNGDPNTPTLIRGKSVVSIEQMVKEYPSIIQALTFFKQLTMNLLIQDVRPKVGRVGQILNPMTNPTDEVNAQNLSQLIIREFHGHRGATTTKLEDAFDRPILAWDKQANRVKAIYPYSPVVSSIYITYDINPLARSTRVQEYLELCSKLPQNDSLQKNLHAAGGLLNELLLFFSLLSGIEVGVSMPNGIYDRTQNVPVKTMLESVYTPGMLSMLEEKIPIKEDGGSREEWLRQLAVTALTVRDFAIGGSFDGIGALYGQIDAGLSRSRDPLSVISLKPTRHVVL